MLRFTKELKGMNRVFRILKICSLAFYKKGILAASMKEEEKQAILHY